VDGVKGRDVSKAGATNEDGSDTSVAEQQYSFPAIWPGAVGMVILLVSVLPTMGGIKYYYDYILPTAVLVLSVVMIVLAVRCRRWFWIPAFVVVVLFFNPVWRLDAGAELGWSLADVAGAVVFFLGAYFISPRPPAEKPTE